jgi:hypothetical protein
MSGLKALVWEECWVLDEARRMGEEFCFDFCFLSFPYVFVCVAGLRVYN